MCTGTEFWMFSWYLFIFIALLKDIYRVSWFPFVFLFNPFWGLCVILLNVGFMIDYIYKYIVYNQISNSLSLQIKTATVHVIKSQALPQLQPRTPQSILRVGGITKTIMYQWGLELIRFSAILRVRICIQVAFLATSPLIFDPSTWDFRPNWSENHICSQRRPLPQPPSHQKALFVCNLMIFGHLFVKLCLICRKKRPNWS